MSGDSEEGEGTEGDEAEEMTDFASSGSMMRWSGYYIGQYPLREHVFVYTAIFLKVPHTYARGDLFLLGRVRKWTNTMSECGMNPCFASSGFSSTILVAGTFALVARKLFCV